MAFLTLFTVCERYFLWILILLTSYIFLELSTCIAHVSRAPLILLFQGYITRQRWPGISSIYSDLLINYIARLLLTMGILVERSLLPHNHATCTINLDSIFLYVTFRLSEITYILLILIHMNLMSRGSIILLPLGHIMSSIVGYHNITSLLIFSSELLFQFFIIQSLYSFY